MLDRALADKAEMFVVFNAVVCTDLSSGTAAPSLIDDWFSTL